MEWRYTVKSVQLLAKLLTLPFIFTIIFPIVAIAAANPHSNGAGSLA